MQENMRNLSQGFGVSINFGIDYQHQSIATTTIPAILKQSVEQALQKSDLASHVENIKVEFQEAASSSYASYLSAKIVRYHSRQFELKIRT